MTQLRATNLGVLELRQAEHTCNSARVRAVFPFDTRPAAFFSPINCLSIVIPDPSLMMRSPARAILGGWTLHRVKLPRHAFTILTAVGFGALTSRVHCDSAVFPTSPFGR